jgi:hypothetical protein
MTSGDRRAAIFGARSAEVEPLRSAHRSCRGAASFIPAYQTLAAGPATPARAATLGRRQQGRTQLHPVPSLLTGIAGVNEKIQKPGTYALSDRHCS